jgi:hypothetical protein
MNVLLDMRSDETEHCRMLYGYTIVHRFNTAVSRRQPQIARCVVVTVQLRSNYDNHIRWAFAASVLLMFCHDRDRSM